MSSLFQIEQQIANIEKMEEQILALLTPPKPVAIKLELPTLITKGGTPVPNYELANDTVATITIKTTDAAGNTVPAPAGDTFSVASSLPASLGAAIGTDAAGHPAVVLTPLVQASPGITITTSDADGLVTDVQIVDVIPGTAKNIVLDLADAVLTPQPEPSNPGP